MASILNVDTINNAAGTSAISIDSSGNALMPGHVVQVGHTKYSTEFVYSSSTSWTTFFTATFTPKVANSHIYIDINTNVGRRAAGETQFNHRLQRNGTTLSAAQHLNTTLTSNFDVFRGPDTSNANLHIFQSFLMVDDSHSTTSQITYTFQVASPNAGYPDIYFNFNGASSTYVRFLEIAQ